MYCPNCGKEIKENDNFCRYCGIDLRCETSSVLTIEKADETNNDEEFVLYEVKNHWRNLLIPVIFTPLFFFYFWNIFLNTHSFLSWVIVFALLVFIFYPIARYKSDSIVFTNKFVHIKVGILNPEQTDISIDDINIVEISQSFFGRLFDYGHVSFSNFNNKLDYGYIETPEDFQCIIDNPEKFIRENLN